MNSSLIGKIEKAKRYEHELERINFNSLEVNFKGDNDIHKVNLTENKWNCSCHFFLGWGTCCHVMALQRILARMLPPEAQESTGDLFQAVGTNA